MAFDSTNDNIYIEIFRFGGSDDLNMFVPLEQLGRYYELRPTIAIPQSRLIDMGITTSNQRTGLHPAIATPFMRMWNDGLAMIIPATQYDGVTNKSHEKSRDIHGRGDDRDESLNTGLLARFHELWLPTHQEPEGIATGNIIPNHYYRLSGLPEAITIGQGGSIQNVVSNNGLIIPKTFGTSKRQLELQTKAQMLLDSDKYSSIVKAIFDGAPPVSPIVGNDMSVKLSTILRLLLGGSKTRTFTVIQGGYDTHANQVLGGSPWLGTHANSMGDLMTSIDKFLADLKVASPELYNKVLIGVHTEFGRRPEENTSLGTDHGTSSPVLAFGPGVKAGFYGRHASLEENTFIDVSGNPPRGNLEILQDYKLFYREMFEKHLGITGADLEYVMPDPNTAIPSRPTSVPLNWYVAPPAVGTPPAPQPPAAPTNLIVTSVSASENTLSWAGNSDATGYKVYRRSPAGSGTYAFVTDVMGTTYNDTNRQPSTQYQYQVTATNADGESVPSNAASITTPAAPAQGVKKAAWSMGATSQGGVNHLFGQPHQNVISNTDSATGFELTSFRITHWAADANGVSASDTVGAQGGSLGFASQGERSSGWINGRTNYNVTEPQLVIRKLDPTKEYIVRTFHSYVDGPSTTTDVRITGSPGLLLKGIAAKNNVSTVLTFDPKKPANNGDIVILFNNASGASVINKVEIEEVGSGGGGGNQSNGYPGAYPATY